jgi:Xaa-Pro aminopeptidase
MNDNFTKEFFIGNRTRLRQLFTGTAPIVLTANGLLQRNADNPYRFRQDSSFWYFTGLDEPDLVLVMDKNKEYLIVPERDTVRQAFDGSVDVEAMSRRSGIEIILDGKSGWKQLSSRMARVKHVATLGAAPAYIERIGLYTNPAREQLIARLKESNAEAELLDLRDHVARLRAVKQAVELTALQQAIDVTVGAIKYATSRGRLLKYAHEYEVEADILRHFKKRGAAGHAFEPIIVSGARACVLHNLSMDGRLSADELLLFDIGAEVSNYAADISRTVAVGTPSSRQQAVHAAVCEVQDFALERLKPGAVLGDYEKEVEEFMGEKLRELGLIRTISSEEVRKYYPHATSHFLGLDVHDAGMYQQPLAAGMVLTCEPGIYIPEEGIGVRIEDDVLVTEDGYELLSKQLPRALQ